MHVVRPVADSEMLDVLRWRNAVAVRRTMITQDPIPLDNHLAWWDRVREDASKRVLLLCEAERRLGIITFFDIADGPDGRTAWWGFYPTDSASEGGGGALRSWLAIERGALVYAFDVLRLDALLCETRADNLGVLALHDRLGFETLAPEPYSNAVKHGLVVKRLSREVFDHGRAAGDVPAIGELRLELHDFDAPRVEPPTLRLAVLGSANWDLAARGLISAFARWTGWKVDAHTPPFGQAAMELLDPASKLRSVERDVWIFADRIEDFGDPFALPGQTDERLVRERFERYERQIRRARAEVGGLFLVHDLAPMRPWARSYEEAVNGTDAVSRLCAEFNAQLASLCGELPDATLLPISALVREIGAMRADPGKYWLMGRIACGPAMAEAWADAVVGAVLFRRGLTARALVLDLDNTLWGGAIGDEGVSGISLSSDYPGNEFKVVQNVALALKARGLPLTICSKNTEGIAMEAIRTHPEMVLREADFVAKRINWAPKSGNIREIAAELSLGLGSLMFVDDNPVERDEARRNCPGLIVPDMPEDVAIWPEFLLRHPALAALSLTAEDLARARSYDIRSRIIAAEREAPSRSAFLKELGLTLEVHDATPATMQRVLQLIAKTNQFNTTQRRYTEADLAARTAAGGYTLTLRLKDKYGSDELIGVVVVDFDMTARKAIIDNFIMSCRVLERGVEAGALAVVGEAALARGCEVIDGRIIVSERNEPCRSVYVDNGFVSLGENRFEFQLADGPPPRPDWLTIVADA